MEVAWRVMKGLGGWGLQRDVDLYETSVFLWNELDEFHGDLYQHDAEEEEEVHVEIVDEVRGKVS